MKNKTHKEWESSGDCHRALIGEKKNIGGFS